MRIETYRISTDQPGFEEIARVHAAIERTTGECGPRLQ